MENENDDLLKRRAGAIPRGPFNTAPIFADRGSERLAAPSAATPWRVPPQTPFSMSCPPKSCPIGPWTLGAR